MSCCGKQIRQIQQSKPIQRHPRLGLQLSLSGTLNPSRPLNTLKATGTKESQKDSQKETPKAPLNVWRTLVISAVPEVSSEARHAIAANIEGAWRAASAASGTSGIESSTRLIGTDASPSAISSELTRMAAFLAQGPGHRGLVYYNGHGSWAGGDTSRAEWDAWGGSVTAAQVTDAFASVAPGSFVLVISDSCSSGAMFEGRRPAAQHGRWALLAACSVSEDAFEENDGGVFSVWGLLPTLAALSGSGSGAGSASASASAFGSITLSALEAGAQERLDIPGSEPLLACGSSVLYTLPLF